MKVAITGHTKGIGSALYDQFTSRGHDVLGFSRSNGYDIDLEDTRIKIISQSLDCDIFVNNAYSFTSQCLLLQDIIKAWTDQRKIIVNIDSKSIFAPVVPNFMQQYVDDKKRQHEIVQALKFKANPYVMELILGLVETDMAEVFVAKKLSASDVAALVVDIIEKKDTLYVQELVLDVPFQDWKNIQQKGQ